MVSFAENAKAYPSLCYFVVIQSMLFLPFSKFLLKMDRGLAEKLVGVLGLGKVDTNMYS